MGAAQAMEGAERPALQVREHAMDPPQHEMGGRCADDLRLVVVVGQAGIASPAIGDHPRARRRGPGDEGMKAARGEIPDRRQPDAARFVLGRPRDRAGNAYLALRAAALPACGRVFCGTEREGGLIDLDQVLEQAAIGVNHGPAQLVQQEPGTLAAAEPELGLELQGGDAVRVAGHDVNGHEPDLQGQVAAVHDRACGQRSLLPAGRTFPARPATLPSPAPVIAAGGADEAVGPALGREMPGAGGFIGKARLEGGAGHGAVMFPAAGHNGTIQEHPADGNRKLNILCDRNQREKPLIRISHKPFRAPGSAIRLADLSALGPRLCFLAG